MSKCTEKFRHETIQMNKQINKINKQTSECIANKCINIDQYG